MTSKPAKAAVAVESPLPSNIEAERNALGAVILENGCMSEMVEFLTVSDFFLNQHRQIFKAMLDLYQLNDPIDSVTLYEILSTAQTLEMAGGMEFVSKLADGLPRTQNVGHYIKLIKEKAILRQIIHEAHDIQKKAFEATEESWLIAERGAQKLINLINPDLMSQTMSRKAASADLLERLRTHEDSKITSGIPELDEILGGFLPGELIVYSADPGVGKTFLGLQAAKTACLAGEHGLFCSGEMMAAHLMARELCSATGVKSSKVRRPSLLTQEDFDKLTAAAEAECPTCQIIGGSLTLPLIRRTAKTFREKNQLKYIIVDYDELVEVQEGSGKWDRQDILFKYLKQMSVSLGVPIIVISQMRKELSDEDERTPKLANLFGSSAKGKDPSIVLFVSRPFVKDLKGNAMDATIFILKSRDGRQGFVQCTFDTDTFRFRKRQEKPISEWVNEPTRSRSNGRGR